MYNDTIAAIATPPGEGGIGTVRLSGPDAERILSRVFVPARGSTEPVESHRLVFGYVRDPRSGEKIDEALAVLMRAPHSYTREDVVEIDCHGGAQPLQGVMAACMAEGARMAQPGEFTLRAFLNGRLDLAQAEAVLDIVKARTDTGLKLAVEQLGGGLSARVKGVRAKLLHALAHLEATIDFPEDDVPPADVSPELLSALDDLNALTASASTGIVLRQGLRTAIVGRPNVGKSSLLNALLKADRAIVTPVPGTTRDTLEEVVNVRGVPLVLTDTAGLRDVPDAADPVERMGIDRTRRALSEADLALMVFDGSEPMADTDLDVIRAVEEAEPRSRVAVINKSDLPARIDLKSLRESLGDVRVVATSAATPGGTGELEETLAGMVLSGVAVPGQEGAMVASLRHLNALQRAQEHLEAALGSISSAVPPAFVAVDLHSALNALGEITGETASEDLLDEIFRNFCIGK
jgi:tRNA modification GTPase